MGLFKTKATQIEFAAVIFEFIKMARFRDTAPRMFPEGTSRFIVDRFVRAEIYLVLLPTIKHYPDKTITHTELLRLIYEHLYRQEFLSFDKFRAFSLEEFKEFEEMFRFGEKTNNGMLYGISKWVYDEPKGNIDILGQMQIVPHLFRLFVAINEILKKNHSKIRIVD